MKHAGAQHERARRDGRSRRGDGGVNRGVAEVDRAAGHALVEARLGAVGERHVATNRLPNVVEQDEAAYELTPGVSALSEDIEVLREQHLDLCFTARVPRSAEGLTRGAIEVERR